mgnify:CR=1 FL=1
MSQAQMMTDENVILVNAHDRVLGLASKEEAHRMDGVCMRAGGVPHRAFSVFVFDEEGRLLIQQRAAEKLLFPLHWANTCCSHPLADGSRFLGSEVRGEEEGACGVVRAAARKLAHELGMRAPEMHVVTRVHYRAPMPGGMYGEHEVDYLVVARGPRGAVRPNPSEVAGVAWVDAAECEALLRGLEHVSPWFERIARALLLPHWFAALARGEVPAGDREIRPL